MSRVPSPPPPAEMSSGPVAESWCYTQVKRRHMQEKCSLHSSSAVLLTALGAKPNAFSSVRSKWWSSHICGPSTTSASVVRRWARSSRAPPSLLGPMTSWSGGWTREMKDCFFSPPLFVLLWLWAEKHPVPLYLLRIIKSSVNVIAGTQSYKSISWGVARLKQAPLTENQDKISTFFLLVALRHVLKTEHVYNNK